jgi:hypothetical protein
MASLIAGHGHGDGSSGIEGVAPQSRVLSIRVVTDRGDPNFAKYQRESNGQVQRALARAITIATRRGADVISMSLGYGAASRPVRMALQNALDHGVVVVASSGNSGDTASAISSGQAPYSFPADYPGVLGVGAVTQTGSAASFSSNNLSVEVAAPGVKVPAQGRDGQYWLVSGTSPACALAAGVAALIKSRYPHLSPALVDQAITSTTQNPPPQGYDARVGFGTVDAAAALTKAAALSHDVNTGRGVKVATQFGGGPAAAPPVPVAPRGTGRLILYAVLAMACLAIAAAAAVRLTRRAPAAAPPGESWPENAPWPGSAPRPGDGAWEASGAWGANGAWPGGGSRPGQGAWEGDRPRLSNGAREGGPREGNGPRPGQGAWEGGRLRPGNGARGGNRSRPGNGARGSNGAWEDSGAWPGSEPWPAQQDGPLAPSGHGPVPPAQPGGPPAPYYRPDLSPQDLPPAQTPPADPGPPPWPPPGR